MTKDAETLELKGMGLIFVVMLSAQPDLTFRVSKDLLNAFPFNDYEVSGSEDPENGELVFTLHRLKDTH